MVRIFKKFIPFTSEYVFQMNGYLRLNDDFAKMYYSIQALEQAAYVLALFCIKNFVLFISSIT